MSQLPTNNDIPSNSRTQKKDEDKRPEITPFEGDVAGVKRKKTGFWAWMRKMFLSDRKPSEIAMDVLENSIVPGIKDNFRNGLVSSLDMFIYQSSKPAGPGNQQNNAVSYNNIFRASTAPAKPQQPQQAQNNNGVDLSNGFVNPCFRTREQARQFLVDKMKSYDYPTLSVHTMYMMMSRHIDYTWDAYGWTKEEIASWDPNRIITHIQSKDYPWMIDLPQAHLIS